MKRIGFTNSRWSGEQGGTRTALLVLAFFLLGFGLSALLLRRPSPPAASEHPRVELSQASCAVLARLDEPVQARFYSLLDPNSDSGLRKLSDHVDNVLAAFAQAAPDKVTVVSQTNADRNVALADGIKGFDLDKGEGCYLGIAFSCAGKKEVLARLSPEWEPALEADISRAIERVGVSDARSKVPATAPVEDRDTIAQIQKEIPNLESLSLEDAIRVARENSVKEFTFTTTKMNELVQEATEELVKAQKQGTTAEQQEALKKLQAIQAAETEKLKEIAASSQLRIEAVKKLKSGR